MNTRTFLLAVAMICGTQCMTAQTDSQQPTGEKQRPTQEQMNKMRATRAAGELMLDEATAAKFIPIYENYLQAMEELRAKGGDNKPCCGMRPGGRKDAPRMGDNRGGKKRGGKKGPKPDGNNAPAPGNQPAPGNAPAPGAQPAQCNAQAPDAKACPGEGKACCEPKTLTDAEVENMLKERFANLRKEADIQEKYYNELHSILTPLQIARVMNFGPREPQSPGR